MTLAGCFYFCFTIKKFEKDFIVSLAISNVVLIRDGIAISL